MNRFLYEIWVLQKCGVWISVIWGLPLPAAQEAKCQGINGAGVESVSTGYSLGALLSPSPSVCLRSLRRQW